MIWVFIFVVVSITICQSLGITDKVLDIIDNGPSVTVPDNIPLPGGN